MSLLANTSITVDPAWPWSLPGVGLAGLAVVAGLLAVLTVWTYLGVRGASGRRIGLMLLLRLLALVVACVVILRPALAFDEEEATQPSKIFILIDASESMKLTDEFDSLSRWDNGRRILKSSLVGQALKKLTDARIEVIYYQGAEDLRAYAAEGQARGKSTDMGLWLHEFLQRHGRESNLRGLVLLSDGIDNGVVFPTLDKAAQLRGVCPLYAFGLGRPTTTTRQNDITVTDIQVEPDPIPVKGKMTVRGFVNAPGLENSNVTVGLYLQEKGAKEPRLVLKDNALLDKTLRNEIVLTADAPESAGEIKVLLKVDPLKDEVSTHNNEAATFATVTKEGVSILWVEGRQRHEAVFAIRHGLGGDPRFHIVYAVKQAGEQGGAVGQDWFQFERRHYDVIVIGDISAQNFSDGKQEVFQKIRDLVHKGTGLLLLAGHDAFSAGGWNTPLAADIAQMLPVVLPPDAGEPNQAKVRMLPTRAGLEYLLRVDPSEKRSQEIWENVLDKLEGISPLGTKKAEGTMFAQGENGQPILLGNKVGNEGRVLVFAGDTTFRVWRRSREMLPAYSAFWKQMMLYLARQENMESSVQVTLEKRRVPAEAGQRLPFTVKALDKQGKPLVKPQFTAKVILPNNEVRDVPITREGEEYRGVFFMEKAAGEYRVEVNAKDADGTLLTKEGVTARFLGYAQDKEMLRTAADHDFLAKLADLSGGRFFQADERQLAQLLDEIVAQKLNQPSARVHHWPDWRRLPASDSVGDQVNLLWNSTALACFLLFSALLCCEWYLRRRWGMV